MTNPLPQRPMAHAVGDKAVRLFVQACPQEWVIASLVPDYGLDVRVELAREGKVTGEEFGAQIKGRRQVQPGPGGVVTANVRNSTVNYWLGKLNPTMIVLVDTSQSRLWFSWLDQAYADYPRRLESEGDTELTLKSQVGADFPEAVGRYVSECFSRLRDEVHLLSDRTQLARFSLHTAGLAKSLTQIHLALTSGRTAEDLQDPLHLMFLEFGIHDSFLLSLWEDDSPWRQPLSFRSAEIVSAKLHEYIRLRSYFWMREKRVTHGNFDLIPFSYDALKRYLVPTLESVWDLQSTLNQIIVLGSSVDSNQSAEAAG